MAYLYETFILLCLISFPPAFHFGRMVWCRARKGERGGGGHRGGAEGSVSHSVLHRQSVHCRARKNNPLAVKRTSNFGRMFHIIQCDAVVFFFTAPPHWLQTLFLMMSSCAKMQPKVHCRNNCIFVVWLFSLYFSKGDGDRLRCPADRPQ